MRKGRRKTAKVCPDVVEAMHPSTPRHYERWIVIKGKHAGKYVRSIRYEKGPTPKMPIWWTIVVVIPSSVGSDIVTGEELRLESTVLCLEDESNESKDRNSHLSRGLRECVPH